MVHPNNEGSWNFQAGGKSQHALSTLDEPPPCPPSTQSPSPRRRSVSVASAHPSVETVISKAKRAASTLWTLLHAQHCTLAEGCIHPGCKDAKLLLLHMKVCPAGSSFACPTNHRGCDQGRKLLAHYKRCKSIRARQVGQGNARRLPSQQHVCLVCTLVARQARSMLEERPPGSFPPSVAATGAVASASPSAVRKPPSKRIISSFMLDSCNRPVKIPAESLISSPKMMPPPPPRIKLCVTEESVRRQDPYFKSDEPEPRTCAPPPVAATTTLGRMGFSESSPTRSVYENAVKSVSFHVSTTNSSRDRALSHSEAKMPPAPPPRPRSQSLGSALTAGQAAAVSHGDCDTIVEEGEPESTDYNAWNPAL